MKANSMFLFVKTFSVWRCHVWRSQRGHYDATIVEYDKLGYGSIMLLDEIAFNRCSDLNRVAGGSLTVLMYMSY